MKVEYDKIRSLLCLDNGWASEISVGELYIPKEIDEELDLAELQEMPGKSYRLDRFKIFPYAPGNWIVNGSTRMQIVKIDKENIYLKTGSLSHAAYVDYGWELGSDTAEKAEPAEPADVCTCTNLLFGHSPDCIYNKKEETTNNVWGISRPKTQPKYETLSDQKQELYNAGENPDWGLR